MSCDAQLASASKKTIYNCDGLLVGAHLFIVQTIGRCTTCARGKGTMDKYELFQACQCHNTPNIEEPQALAHHWLLVGTWPSEFALI